MRIFNIIMNRKLGGAEQAFLDYYQALTSSGHSVFNITSSFAQINKQIINPIKLPNLFPWCIISKIYLKLLIFFYKPDLIIAHGGRAVNFACHSRKRYVPVVGVTHSYSTRHILKCDYIIALDQALKNHLIANDYPESKIFIVPNMINKLPKKSSDIGLVSKKSDYIIASLGRFVPEKGFNYLIEAIHILITKGYGVKLMLGGSGLLEADLKNLTLDLNLEKNVKFLGWIKDKEAFFKDVDIFCIPSVFETFGIVALEAMSYSKPIIATNTVGLMGIFEPEVDALIVDTSSSQKLADAIAFLIDNPKVAEQLRQNAYNKLVTKYDIKIVAQKLSETLSKILHLSTNISKK